MKTQTHVNQNSTFTEERLQRARAALTSAFADAAAQGTLEERVSARLEAYASATPAGSLEREVVTSQLEKWCAAISYFNELHGAGRLQTGVVKMTFSFARDDAELLCAVVEQTKRDIDLIEPRLEEAVKAGILSEADKAAILAKPFLNEQADDAISAISAVKDAGDLSFE